MGGVCCIDRNIAVALDKALCVLPRDSSKTEGLQRHADRQSTLSASPSLLPFADRAELVAQSTCTWITSSLSTVPALWLTVIHGSLVVTWKSTGD